MIEQKKAVIYARYSTSNQTEQTIESQLRACYDYANKKGFIVIKEYIDRGISGTREDRPAFQEMKRDAEKKQFQVVIVYMFDRFARDRYISVVYKEHLKRLGIPVVSVVENVDSDTTAGMLYESLAEIFAAEYPKNISIRSKNGQANNIKKGLIISGQLPFGYKNVNKKAVAIPEQAEKVRYIYESYLNDVPFKQMAASLNMLGIKTRNGQNFDEMKFYRILRNRNYTGKYKYKNGEHSGIYEGIYEKIIDEEVFNKVQAKIDSRRKTPAFAKARTVFILQGKLYCGYCGNIIYSEQGYTCKNGKKYWDYYLCKAKKRKKLNIQCESKRHHKEELEKKVIQDIFKNILNPEKIEEIAEDIYTNKSKEKNIAPIKYIESKIKTVEKNINEAILKIKNVTSINVIQRLEKEVDELVKQKEMLEIEKVKLEYQNKAQFTKQDYKDFLNSFLGGDIKNLDYQKRIVNTFVNRIYLERDSYMIYYNSCDGSDPVSFARHQEIVKKQKGIYSPSLMV
ncbi:MAG: recombinase family protein [Elusimicrobiota bacterium]|jgi:DNA invertase Pin-like site-specific DNA recombinase|nr:recombinase family protein [Elusimicrobiota bacterium]